MENPFATPLFGRVVAAPSHFGYITNLLNTPNVNRVIIEYESTAAMNMRIAAMEKQERLEKEIALLKTEVEKLRADRKRKIDDSETPEAKRQQV